MLQLLKEHISEGVLGPRRYSSERFQMIEVNDAKLSHYTQRIAREREAAATASTEAVRQLHLRIAELYERELAAIRSLS
jgi:hypothetical protein